MDKFYKTAIKGVGMAVPKNLIANDNLAKIMDTTDEWITTRTGIKKRHVLSGDEKLSDVAFQASKNALNHAKIEAQEIDLIISATSVSDNFYPSLACEVQAKLGIKNCPAFDVTAACSGFLYVMNIAKNFIRTGEAKNVLIIGADIHSRFVNWEDRGTCVLFGDGAGAMVLSQSDQDDILAIKIHADGEKSDKLKLPVKGKNCPLVEPQSNSDQYLYMDGREVYKFAVNIVPTSIEEVLEISGLKINDIDNFVIHQANVRIMQAAADRLGVSMEKMICYIQDYGNTSAASIPIAFARAVEEGKIKPNSTIAMSGFGAGLTWGSAIIKWNG